MPDIAALRSQYFVEAEDGSPPTEPVPLTFQDSKVTPIIDCNAYNTEISTALALVGTGAASEANSGHFVLIANWWLGLAGGEYEATSAHSGAVGPLASLFGPAVRNTSPYMLDGLGGVASLLEILKDKARKGVDVRVLGWVSFALMGYAMAQSGGASSIARVNSLSMKSIKELRAEPKIGAKAVLNVIAHTAGAVHSKMAIIGNDTHAIAFTGGLDFEEQRFAMPGHPGPLTWHDVVAKVEGPAVQALYDWFKDMWHENVSRPVRRFKFEGETMPSFLPGTPVLPARALPVIPVGTHHVQSLRTVPRFNYRWYNCLPENDPISFAPQGLFEIRSAMRKALRNAQTYIYMEDQSYWSQEILSWVRDAIQARPNLRVILLASGGADPNDPDFPDAYLSNSINHGLLENLTPAQRGQVRMFRRLGDVLPKIVMTATGPIALGIIVTVVAPAGANSLVTLSDTAQQNVAANALRRMRWFIEAGGNRFRVVGNPAIAKDSHIILEVENSSGSTAPTAGEYMLLEQAGITIHSKTTLVDDEWAIIGSANIMRRSLYTDLEHAVGVLDEEELLVKEYRTRLWADHFRHPTPSDFNDIQEALHAWEPSWGVAGIVSTRPANLEPIAIPIVPDAPLTGSVKSKYDTYEDLDSREEWGGLCP